MSRQLNKHIRHSRDRGNKLRDEYRARLKKIEHDMKYGPLWKRWYLRLLEGMEV